MSVAERMPDELRAELAAPDRRKRLLVDPRSVPWRFSSIKEVDRSPFHYWWSLQSGGREETLSMRLGAGGHALTFGTPEVVVYRGGEFTNSKGKTKKYSAVRSGEMWEDFLAKHDRDVILNETEYETASGIARALTSDLDADALLFAPGVKHEHDVTWQIGDRDCRGRLDALTPNAVIDLKCVKDANPKWFPTQAVRAGWHAQATWYADGVAAAGLGQRQPYLIAVENKPPFPVTVWRLRPATIEHGRRMYQRWIDIIRKCEAEDTWPGYASKVIDLEVPHYLSGRVADDSSDGESINESADD